MTDEIIGELVEEPGEALELRPAQSLVAANDPQVFIERTVAVADALMKVVRQKGLISRIGLKDYPQVEAWTLLGSMMGAFGQAIFPVTTWTKEYHDPTTGDVIGWEARVEAQTLEGKVVGAAEAMCTRKEGKWRTSDDYAIRSMAQTRATSKALRQPLGFIMQMAGFSSTPAEEIDDTRQGRSASASAAQAAQAAQVEAELPLLRERLQKGLDALVGKPGWALEEVLAVAAATYARPVNQLTDLSGTEIKGIIEAMQKYGGVKV